MNYQPTQPSMQQPRSKRYFEAVIVCVNYADFLAQTLPHTLNHLDKVVVVTDSKDTHTQLLCHYYDVECIVTDSFYDDGAVFNKGKGINAGLQRLSQRDWVLHLDADVFLPPRTRLILDSIYLDPLAVHGLDRMNCVGFANWIRYLANPKLMHQGYYLVHGNSFPHGSRVSHYNQDGWFPIGFFQLWNPLKSGIVRYPECNQGADHTDVVFAKAFPIDRRRFIPDFYVIHLESEVVKMGANWNGRTTREFSIQPDRS